MRPTFPVILAASLLLAGCGSTRVVTVLTTSSATSARSHSPTAPTRSHSPTATTRVPGEADFTFQLPRASRQNQCAVSDGSAQIIFFSRPLRVARLCGAQLTVKGWSAGYETAAPDGHELQYCYLRDAASTVVATVLDTSTGTAGPGACTGLIATRDWYEAQADPTLCRVPGTRTTLKEPPGSSCGSRSSGGS